LFRASRDQFFFQISAIHQQILNTLSQWELTLRMFLGAGIGKRDGSGHNNPANCPAANRNYNYLANRNNNIGFRVVSAVFPALFYCQNWTMGIVRVYPEESRPVPVTEITLSEYKTGSDSLVGAIRTVVRPIKL
jgi:hypothetical protein